MRHTFCESDCHALILCTSCRLVIDHWEALTGAYDADCPSPVAKWEGPREVHAVGAGSIPAGATT